MKKTPAKKVKKIPGKHNLSVGTSGAKKPRKDKQREERIVMEIIVDAYSPEEQAMGWYYYLEGKLRVPFLARCIAERAISPLRKGDEIEIIGMASEVECQHEMFVETPWDRRTLAIPLAQVQPITAGIDNGSENANYATRPGHEGCKVYTYSINLAHTLVAALHCRLGAENSFGDRCQKRSWNGL